MGPVVDMMICSMGLHNCLAVAFKTLRVKSQNVQSDLDPQLLMDLRFSAVAGKRYEAARKFLLDGRSRWHLVILALVLEPVRFVSSWLMRRAKETDMASRVAALDLAWHPVSPTIAAAQYLATLLLGKHLVYDYCGNLWGATPCWIGAAGTRYRHVRCAR